MFKWVVSAELSRWPPQPGAVPDRYHILQGRYPARLCDLSGRWLPGDQHDSLGVGNLSRQTPPELSDSAKPGSAAVPPEQRLAASQPCHGRSWKRLLVSVARLYVRLLGPRQPVNTAP